MSWDASWSLPRKKYTDDEVRCAAAAVIGALEGARLEPAEEGDEGIVVWVDRDVWAGRPSREEECECSFIVDGPLDEEGEPSHGAWSLWLSSEDGENRAVWEPIAEIAAAVSVQLGGSYEADAL